MGVVGESAFFIGAAVIVFLFAVVTEIRSVQQYQRSECKVTQAAINYLEEVKKNSPKVTLKREQVHQKLGEKLGGKVWDWLKEHLAGRLDSTGEAYQTQLQDNHCMILHYPSRLWRE